MKLRFRFHLLSLLIATFVVAPILYLNLNPRYVLLIDHPEMNVDLYRLSKSKDAYYNHFAFYSRGVYLVYSPVYVAHGWPYNYQTRFCYDVLRFVSEKDLKSPESYQNYFKDFPNDLDKKEEIKEPNGFDGKWYTNALIADIAIGLAIFISAGSICELLTIFLYRHKVKPSIGVNAHD